MQDNRAYANGRALTNGTLQKPNGTSLKTIPITQPQQAQRARQSTETEAATEEKKPFTMPVEQQFGSFS